MRILLFKNNSRVDWIMSFGVILIHEVNLGIIISFDTVVHPFCKIRSILTHDSCKCIESTANIDNRTAHVLLHEWHQYILHTSYPHEYYFSFRVDQLFPHFLCNLLRIIGSSLLWDLYVGIDSVHSEVLSIFFMLHEFTNESDLLSSSHETDTICIIAKYPSARYNCIDRFQIELWNFPKSSEEYIALEITDCLENRKEKNPKSEYCKKLVADKFHDFCTLFCFWSVSSNSYKKTHQREKIIDCKRSDLRHRVIFNANNLIVPEEVSILSHVDILIWFCEGAIPRLGASDWILSEKIIIPISKTENIQIFAK